MKSLMYRQPREAAIIFASTEEDLDLAYVMRRRKKIQVYLTLFLACASMAITIALLYYMQSGWDQAKTRDAAATNGSIQIDDHLMPEAVGLQEEIAEKVLRLHILANSDGDDDQEVKLVVRDVIRAYLSDVPADVDTKEDLKVYIQANMDEIISLANTTLATCGYTYEAKAELTIANFPFKVYGDFFLPAGEYETLQITLGEADGQNWWCILFPSLCLAPCIDILEDPDASAEDTNCNQTSPLPTNTQTSSNSLANGNSITIAPIGPISDLTAPTLTPFVEKKTSSDNVIGEAPNAPSHIMSARERLYRSLEQREYDAIRMDNKDIKIKLSFLDFLK